MQKAQASYLRNVKELIEEDEIESALQLLDKVDTDLQIGIENDLVLQKSRFKSNEKDMQRGIMPFEYYQRTKQQVKFALLSIVDGIPRKIELNSMINGVKAMNFSVPDEEALEKIIGDKSRLVKIGWLEMALKATKSVGRIVCSNGATGTGFMLEGGYMLTNNHVLPDEDTAESAYIEFNFEEDASGARKTRYQYKFDADTFLTSSFKELDYTRIKVIDNPETPLKDWGFLQLAPDATPVIGDPVNIIQHPKGDVKQIALTANDVLSIWDKYLYYKADTEPGSSGSPVFNQSWQVVALHHAGKLMSEGGMQINEKGDKASANRGILISQILADIKAKTS
jgi:V8-like Glu-specific endopeptidase